jgi:hypothetical protein
MLFVCEATRRGGIRGIQRTKLASLGLGLGGLHFAALSARFAFARPNFQARWGRSERSGRGTGTPLLFLACLRGLYFGAGKAGQPMAKFHSAGGRLLATLFLDFPLLIVLVLLALPPPPVRQPSSPQRVYSPTLRALLPSYFHCGSSSIASELHFWVCYKKSEQEPLRHLLQIVVFYFQNTP